MLARRVFYALALFVVTAVPASAGLVTVGSVTASQYDYPYFGAMVQATGTTLLGDVHLIVTSPTGAVTVVQPDSIERTNLDGYGLYVIYQIRKYAGDVVKPGDVLTAVVRDQDAADGSKDEPCAAPQTKKKKSSSETATCR
jgi:hypothetical protein